MRSYILKYLNEKVEAITEVISETGKFRITPTAQLNFRAKNSSRFRRYPVTKQGRNKKPAIPAPRQKRKRGQVASRCHLVTEPLQQRKVQGKLNLAEDEEQCLHCFILLFCYPQNVVILTKKVGGRNGWAFAIRSTPPFWGLPPRF